MNKYSFVLILTLLGIGLQAQHQNILISDENAPEETVILVNPNNPNEVLAGANINNCCVSKDGGLTWDCQLMSSEFGVWGDPCIAVDTAGDYYFFSLANPPVGSWIDRIVCQKSDDVGDSWQEATYMGLDGTKAQDKEWVSIDRSNNNIYVTWTQFDAYGSSNSSDSSIIRFSKSTDAGQTWSEAIRLNKVAGDCIDDDNTVEGAVPAVGPNGEIYVSWAGPEGIVFDRSNDEGETWLADDIFVTDFPGGWAYSIPGFMRCNGLPVTVCDTSGGSHHGTIYINWSDQRNGDDDTDVWLIKSIDGGNSWSEVKRVNNDGPGTHQFLTWMAVDQANGDLYFVWYDRRNTSQNMTEVYMAVSKDGGETFQNFKVSEDAFMPFDNVFMGDYNNVSVHDGVVRPIWTEYYQESVGGGYLSIWTAIIDHAFIGMDEPVLAGFKLDQNFPNPAFGKTMIKYKLPQASAVTLSVVDIYGREVYRVIDGEYQSSGKYFKEIQFDNFTQKPGIFFYELKTKFGSETRKMIVL